MDLSEINWLGLPENRYYKEASSKKQIVLHHTASGKGIEGDYQWWLNDPKRIATFMIIDHEGKMHQLFSSKFWAHHLGMPNIYNTARNKESIGIEIDSWGQLAPDGTDYRSWAGGRVLSKDAVVYPEGFKAYANSPAFQKLGVVGKSCKFYESYTLAQIASLKKLLLYLCKTYNIPTAYNADMWDYSKNAVEGKPGIWTHVSYRKDKSDCHPAPELIKMLKSLSTWI